MPVFDASSSPGRQHFFEYPKRGLIHSIPGFSIALVLGDLQLGSCRRVAVLGILEEPVIRVAVIQFPQHSAHKQYVIA
jgi:hypothetical protein